MTERPLHPDDVYRRPEPLDPDDAYDSARQREVDEMSDYIEALVEIRDNPNCDAPAKADEVLKRWRRR